MNGPCHRVQRNGAKRERIGEGFLKRGILTRLWRLKEGGKDKVSETRRGKKRAMKEDPHNLGLKVVEVVPS